MSTVTLVQLQEIVPTIRRKFTLEEYHWLIRQGFFADERVELIDGEIVRMPPTGPEHSTSNDRISSLLILLLANKPYYVRVQNPLALGEHEPVPDVAVVPGSPDDYRHSHPTTALLVVEIADTSLQYDRTTKMSLYASAGIPEYWIVNLVERRLEVYREPSSLEPETPFNALYKSLRLYSAQESVSPLFAPEVSIQVGQLIQ